MVPCILNTPIAVTNMFPAAWFIILIFSLAFAATGNIARVNKSPITLPLARRVNLTSIQNLVQHDQTRAKLLKAQGTAKASGLNVDAVINSPAENQAVSYVAPVGIGVPPTTCKSWLNSPWNVYFFIECSRFSHHRYWKVCISIANSSSC